MLRTAACALAAISLLALPAHADNVRRACMADFHKFCDGPKALLGPMKCMRAHASELSDACKAAWTAHEKAKSDPKPGDG
jgi:hypothetical protein